MANGVFTPYSTVSPLFGILPTWVRQDQQERIASYQIYEEIYWNHPETFKLIFRGEEDKAIYVPSGRVIVEAANRFVGVNLGWTADPDPVAGSDGDKQAITAAFKALFDREDFLTKYYANKRFGLIRGDWLFHITADDTKLEGTRISIHTVDPASYFPIFEDELFEGGSAERIGRVHLAEQFVDPTGKTLVRRQTYEKEYDSNNVPTGTILTSLAIFEPDKWFTAEGPIRAILQPTPLPAGITTIPVYHIKNFEAPGDEYGSSEMRGLERMMVGINQSLSDEDISLALAGLGVYTTSTAGPVDEDGNDVDWIIGPARVIENVTDFKRVNGVGSVQPFQDHINSIFNFVKQSSGTPDSAIGRVDVQIAESGVALLLEMAPILAKSTEKDGIIAGKLKQFFFDLATQWFPTYESMNFGEARLLPTFGNKLPKNSKQIIDETLAMVSSDPPIMSATTARQILKAELGIEFSENELASIIQERQALAEAAPADTFGARADGELAAGNEDNASSNGQVGATA